MTPVTRIFAREAAEFARSRGLLLLVFVAPVVLLLLIGNLRVREPVLRVAIVAAESEQAAIARLRSVLDELSGVEVVRWPGETTDARARSVSEQVDVVAIREDGWRYYTPLTNRYRLQLADGVVQDLAISMAREEARDRQLDLLRELASSIAGAAPASTLVISLEREIKAAGSVPTPVIRAALSNRLVPYFPPISQVDRTIVPGFIALIAVFLPFLLASGGLVKEREAGTLETLILAARRSWMHVAAGKLILPVCLAMIVTLLLLVVARTAYGFGIKPGIVAALAVQLVAALASAMLGFSISTLIKSQQEAYLTSAIYLVALILVTGMIYPIEQAAAPVILVSYAFPLTFSAQPLEAWMMLGANAVMNRWHLAALVGQLGVSLLLCVLAVRRAQRSL